ncbi:carbon-nitrogen hydrolase [Mycena floridula]|nr:carbon-nitrogen hydrolase [Mycena floridula]
MPLIPKIPLRVAVVQFAPKIGQVQANLTRARELCRTITPRSVDLICFPEMIFTGYMFPNAAAISPYLEHPRIGATSQFCSELAEQLKCYVVAGYPERLAPDELPPSNANDSDPPVGANSAVMYDPDGKWVGGYRKTNLFSTDKTWAVPGPGLTTFDLPPPFSKLSLAICMDLNVHPPVAVTEATILEGPYELAEHCLANGSKVLILLNAWLYSEQDAEENIDKDQDNIYAWNTLNFWAQRLRPLWVKSETATEEEDSSKPETIVVVCNRTGEENGVTFAGSSAIFSMQRESGRPKLLDMMSQSEEGVRIWDILI